MLQKADVRGPLKKVGTANKINLHFAVDQQITKSVCSRSAAGTGVNPSGTTKLRTDTVPGDSPSLPDSSLCSE